MGLSSMKPFKLLEFLDAVSEDLNQSHSPQNFLIQFPKIIHKFLPIRHVIVFYKDFVGNIFTSYTSELGNDSVLSLREDSNLIKSFFARQESLLLENEDDIYRNLFNRDSDNILDRFELNYIFPLHCKKHYRGVLLAEVDKKTVRMLKEIEAALRLAVQFFIPILEIERMETENDRNYYRLFKFDRLVLLGEMVASIAHELKTPMNTALLEIQELSDSIFDKNDIIASFGKIKQEILRVNRFIESLLSFSKFKEIYFEKIDINEFIEKILLEIPRKRIPFECKIHRKFEHPIIINSDRNRLRQVFLNILFNAFDAVTGNAGEIIIKTYSEYKETQKDTKYIISIKDNGSGIPQDIKERVLEPFFTTKSNGTGLGLYISYGIMQSLKGDLEIESSEKGTTVYIILSGRSQ